MENEIIKSEQRRFTRSAARIEGTEQFEPTCLFLALETLLALADRC